MSIRVLQVIPSLVQGGAEKQLTLLATGLPRDEFDVHVGVLTRDGPYHETLDAREIPVKLIGKRWKVDPAAYLRLCRWIRRLRPDIVHTWLFAANCYGRQAAIAAGVKHVIAGERCVDRWKVWHELAIDRYLARRTERIVTNSNGVREFYMGHGIPAEKFVVIPNGIAAFEAGDRLGRSELLHQLDVPDDARLIGAIGRLWPQKRYKDLIYAFELLASARDDVHLLIIGSGPQQDQLVSYRSKMTYGDRIHLLGSRQDVPQLLPHFDCFWLGSAYEGQSNAMMEALSAAVPVVGTNIAGNRDLVENDRTGFLVSLGDCAGFASATNQLLDDPQLAKRLGEAGRDRMLREFSVEKMIERHAALYRELTAVQPTVPAN